MLDASLQGLENKVSYEAMLFSIKEAALKTMGYPLTIPAQQAKLDRAAPTEQPRGLKAEVSLGNKDDTLKVDVVLQRPEFILCVAHG